MTPIAVEQLTKVFRGKKGRQVEALKNLSLSVSEAEIVGFLGPNGAGKSTTIKTLIGQIRPTSGSAKLFGKDAGDPSARQNVGYLAENPAFYNFLTAREYLELVGCAYGMQKHRIREESDRVLELLDLSDASNRPMKGFSKGMIQRLGLAQTLLHDPDLYILDEPMSGLDPVGRSLVKKLMLDLKKKGKTVFFSTHVIADVEAVCDRVVIVSQGELRAVNTVSEIAAVGIEGYAVHLEGPPPPGLTRYLVDESEIQRRSIYVPRQELSHVMQEIDKSGCTVRLIEPQRKSLEDFFLEMIA
jgi:ABC-2 type transport system ATP-binding protein